MFRDKNYYRFLELSGVLNESNKSITKISFFDMDGSLIDTPSPETGIDIYKQKLGADWPYNGWWGRPETLDYTIFDIKAFDSVKERLMRDNNDPSILTCLLTARINKLKTDVINLLNHLNLNFDIYSLKEDKKEKDARILDYISMYPIIKEIDIYDDRDKEFALFQPLKQKLAEKNINVNIYKCDKGNITEI